MISNSFALQGIPLPWLLVPLLQKLPLSECETPTHHSNSNEEYEETFRVPSHYNPLHTFTLPAGSGRHYQQQYGDMYFLRLAKLKPEVERVATEAWEGFSVRTLCMMK